MIKDKKLISYEVGYFNLVMTSKVLNTLHYATKLKKTIVSKSTLQRVSATITPHIISEFKIKYNEAEKYASADFLKSIDLSIALVIVLNADLYALWKDYGLR